MDSASNLVVDHETPLNYVALATETEGYLATDLKDLVGRAVHQTTIRCMKQKDASEESVQVGIFVITSPIEGHERSKSLTTVRT